MRKFTTIALAMILSFLSGSSFLVKEQAFAATNKAKQVIDTLGIMDTDQRKVDATGRVSRERFAQMLVNMSSLKDRVTAECNVSLFKDVSKKHWAAGYIQTAITQGWMSGYLNGSFKPKQGITLQEAVNGVTKLLGYTDSDFTGNLTGGQMALYTSKSLNKNISRSKTGYLTEEDCINLFYNTLNATTKDGKLYAESLGFNINSDGEMDFLSLVNDKSEGPVIVDDDWKAEIPFITSSAAYYRNGVECKSSDLEDYDVVYYSESLRTIWAYDHKVTGRVEKINPNQLSPQTVTVAGTEYTLGSAKMSEEFSTIGSVDEGDIITLLLGKDNTVVEALTLEEYNATVTGVVLETGQKMVEDEDGTLKSGSYIVIVDAAGNQYTQDYIKSDFYINSGDLVKITYENGKVTVDNYKYEASSIGNNTFNSEGTMLGGVPLASNVKILDMVGKTYLNIYPDRLAGIILLSDPVYYRLNVNREISELILTDVTGDLYRYGVFTGYSDQGSKLVFDYLIDGEKGSLASYSNMSTIVGPQAFLFEGTTITKSNELKAAVIQSVGKSKVQAGDEVYPFADNYDVYYVKDGVYTKTTMDKVSDLKKYELTAYYDKAVSLGGRVRIIIAKSIT